MAGIWRVLVGGSIVLLVFGNGAEAFHGRFGGAVAPSASYYYYVPSYYYGYCPPLIAVTPATVAPVPAYAIPTPAPASQTIEPPLARPPMPPAKAADDIRLPVMVAARFESNGEVCRVSFWNLSGRDRTLSIDGKTWTLPKERSVTLDLPRRFAWQLEQRPQRVERVAEGQSTHDVVIRE